MRICIDTAGPSRDKNLFPHGHMDFFGCAVVERMPTGSASPARTTSSTTPRVAATPAGVGPSLQLYNDNVMNRNMVLPRANIVIVFPPV